MFSLIKLGLKFTLWFSLSFFILSLDISGKPFFHHINQMVGPWKASVTRQMRVYSRKTTKTVKAMFEPK